MKSAPPVQDKGVEEPRATATTRVATIVRALPYLLAVLVVSVPLMFAWGSFLVYYDKAWEAFGDGRVIAGVVNLLLVTLLVVFVACVTLTFILASKSLGAAAWRWSEGRPTLRAGLASARFGLASVAVIAAAVGLLTWLPIHQAASDSRTLKESLEEAGNRVATLLAVDAAPALAATEEPEAPPEPNAPEPYFPEQEEPLEETPAEPVLTPQRGEERGNDPAPDKPAPDKPVLSKPVPSKPAANEPVANEPVANESASNKPANDISGVDPAVLGAAAPAVDEAAFTLEGPVLDPPTTLEEPAAAPSEPAVAPEPLPEPAIPSEYETLPGDTSPKNTSSEIPPEDVLPGETLPGVPEDVPPHSEDPTLP